jgi:AcrR family transcriptional regulator
MVATVSPRQRIMRAATRLYESGDPPSVHAIARAAGVSRTTLYRVFPSRAALLDALAIAPEPDTRQRILEATLRLLAGRSLADLSMDELASDAGVSRANLYRLFPGKSALFRAILLGYSPFEPVMALLARAGERPPEEVIPEVVLAAYRTVARRRGIVRTLLLEITSMAPETQQAFADTGVQAFAAFGRYLAAQMSAGRLRRMHPMLALQSLIGGVILHLLAEPVFGQAGMNAPRGEAAVLQLAQVWLHGMRPGA